MNRRPFYLPLILLFASCAGEVKKTETDKPVAAKPEIEMPQTASVNTETKEIPEIKAPEKPEAIQFIPPAIIEFVPPEITDGQVQRVEFHTDPEAAAYGNELAGSYESWEPRREPPISSEQQILQIVEEQAEFPGGKSAMVKFISDNFVFPEYAKENGIEGKAYIRFVVSKEGELSDIKVIKGVPGCKECDQEAKRIIKAMPKWIPGKNKGVAVDSYYTLPISFKL